MVSKRTLPERRNPLLAPIESTSKEVLIDRRRLGQTNLAVKPGVAGVTSATKSENTGFFDYAHLRVPLPKDLSGSGIFTLTKNTAFPESYFLMRRSSDGYVSATGMFKAAFPWASLAEEEADRKYQKTFPSAGGEEVAGSVWVAPEEALALSDEYNMRHWIEALLDPAPIASGNKDKERSGNHIQQPPKFDISSAAPALLPSQSGLRSTRARSTRSTSPSKIATPSRKMATPRKSRAARSSKSDIAKAEDLLESTAAKASSALQNVVSNGTDIAESLASDLVNGSTKSPSKDDVAEGTVTIEVRETIEHKGNSETKTTDVKIAVPHSHAELNEPEDPTKMIEEAKRMVQEAQKLDAAASAGAVKVSKRKAEEVLEDGDALGRPSKIAKSAYTTEQKLTKEKVTRRALVGLGVMAAIGTAFQYFA